MAGAAAMATSAFIMPSPAHAALSGTIAVTSPSNAKIAADTAKQVVLLTVSGAGAPVLSEDTVTGVDLGGDAACQNLDTYVVTSATTISVKTPTGGCPVSSGGTAEPIVLRISGDTLTKTSAITFVPPPAIAAVGDNPVITDNSVSLLPANQVKTFNSAGGQYVRITADAAFAFDPRSSAALSVNMGGKAGTDVKVYATATGTTPLANTVAGSVGNALTFKTASGMTTTDPLVTITQNGVSKSFLPAATGVSVVTPPTVTGLSLTSGRAGDATAVTVKGTNFDKVGGNYGTTTLVKFCGQNATFAATPVNAAGTEIYAITPTAVTTMLGASKYAGPCDVVVTNSTPSAGNTSAVNAAASFTFVKE
ncbi:IPT/TIG domain-containing protein [Actinoplanes sp. LDG1-06]|uniref:IPT/TIG domain-containing protein n=1 Tax=Paractinoplanes ovalisporus TaxID=2810368 RepID=A0ABS2AP53_9ACTN|nr:IPT/TIG domain-containing protein [Actinoplanes ovalisporus]MBM2621594.1 IPT/TIG domain-containing protein [Actinoplanes ovalisporus]